MAIRKIMLFVFTISIANGVMAQFGSSEKVYCYEYQYTMEDGIKSQDKAGSVVFVNFQNSMIGFVKTTKSEVASKGISYFENEARNNLAQNYRKYNSSPANTDLQADIYLFDNSNSTSSKYTYRRKTKYADYGMYGASWKQEFWNANCYTFSTDRNDFVMWYLGEPQSAFNFSYGGTSNYTSLRYYYKLIDANKLKPSVDDLW